jgi:hypothetical protein
MKKLAILVGALVLTGSTFAQEKQYTPESGDWAIGVDATPFLSYFGNFIGGNGLNAAPSWNFLTTNQTITGKYFVEDDKAYRGSLRIGFGSVTERGMSNQTGAVAPIYPALGSTVEDTYKSGFNNIGLAGGLEFRKGTGRLIGFYGAELGIAFGSSKEAYTYGNAIVAADGTIPATTDFGFNLVDDTYNNDARVTESKSGSMFGVGVRGFIGAEYFILPKMSIGGEFGWGLGLMSMGASSRTTESTDGTTIGQQTIEGTKTSSFALDTDFNNSVFGPAGSLRLTFHF